MREPIFILGPGRSFTSVIGSMIGQHPELFGLPETNLATSDTVGRWYNTLPGMTAFRAGVLRMLAYLHHGVQTAAAVDDVDRWLQARGHMTTGQLYDHAERLVHPRRLVDKSPLHVMTDTSLARLPQISTGAKYLRIARHPYSNGKSIVATGWYLAGLRAWGGSAWDQCTNPPTLDPQFHWLDIHDRIDRFFASLSPDSHRTIRGEDLLADPRRVLRKIALWLEIDDSDAAIEAMLHPERSPFATPGPYNAELGNDPGFLESPELRPFTPPKVPLSARLPWRGDMEGFTPEVIHRARRFGYTDDPMPAPALPEGFDGSWGKLTAIEPDGEGFPMAHGSLLDNSCVGLPPLRRVNSVQHKPEPSYGGGNFGAFTASDYAVAVFDSAQEPALEGIDLKSGEVLWQSELDLLPMPSDGLPGRFLGGLLLVRLIFENGRTRRCIYAGNRVEIVCLDLDGKVIWRRPTCDIVSVFGAAARDHGTPRCLRYSRDNALVYGSRNGYVGKLDPLTGATLDIRDLSTRLYHAGDWIPGFFKVRQSIVLHGDHAYFQGKFATHVDVSFSDALPTSLLRLQVSGTADSRIEQLPERITLDTMPAHQVIGAVGDGRVGGSPVSRLREDGKLVVFCNSFPEDIGPSEDGAVYQFTATRDEGDRLVRQWRCVAFHPDDPKVTAAPAIDQLTDTLLACHRFAMMIFAQATMREGEIVPDLVLSPLDCLVPEIASKATTAEFSSPITIARDRGDRNFVAYVALAVWEASSMRSFPFLTALEVRTEPELRVVPLWGHALRVDQEGAALPGARSFAQPALFSVTEGGHTQSGLVMGMMMHGLSIFR
ncbi:Sulfotransferase family protein [Roseivivax lentus]|uniref:Sulfotransferase family protein n=1 Tax=Roseivivax lentus TaxID=633194 RepID=A0A1N7PXL1_9RHOB|nr:sulfotransferase [Roseivivax lentus]SIT15326.1 Sulfotransferase family protein [Roseivivax lentus]